MDHVRDSHNWKLLLSLRIKQTEIKFIMLIFGILSIILVMLLFGLLTQMDTPNGILILVKTQQTMHHFGLLIISLVSEEHEMMY